MRCFLSDDRDILPLWTGSKTNVNMNMCKHSPHCPLHQRPSPFSGNCPDSSLLAVFTVKLTKWTRLWKPIGKTTVPQTTVLWEITLFKNLPLFCSDPIAKTGSTKKPSRRATCCSTGSKSCPESSTCNCGGQNPSLQHSWFTQICSLSGKKNLLYCVHNKNLFNCWNCFFVVYLRKEAETLFHINSSINYFIYRKL